MLFWFGMSAALGAGEAGTEELSPGRDPSLPVVGGEFVVKADWPATGALIVAGHVSDGGIGGGRLRMFSCTATLITSDVVLTAAHCVEYEQALEGTGYTWTSVDLYWSRTANLASLGYGEEASPPLPDDAVLVKGHLQHPGWSGLSDGWLGQSDDLALGWLASRVTDTDPGLIATLEDSGALAPGQPLSVVGYGLDGDGADATSGVKRAAEAQVLEVAEWEFALGHNEDDGVICDGRYTSLRDCNLGF